MIALLVENAASDAREPSSTQRLLLSGAGYTRVWLGVILTIHAVLLAWAAWCHTPVSTEVGQLPAGISHLLFGRFELCRVNPPLVRSIGALPVMFASPQTDWSAYDTNPLQRCESRVGFDFLSANGFRSFWLFTLARWACIPFSLAGAVAGFQWARRLYSVEAGWIVLVCWCSCPYVLGHAAIVTTDLPAAALGLVAMRCFWSWLRSPDWTRAALVGGSLGLAGLTKFTLLVLSPLVPVVWVAYRFAEGKATSSMQWSRQGGMLLIMLLVNVYVIHCGYLFDGTLRPLEQYRFRTMMLTGCDSLNDVPREGANRFTHTWLGKVRVPFPADMVQGIDAQRFDFERGFPSYLGGQWADHGWWYYYLYALAVKVPLGTWLLVWLATGVTILAREYTMSWRDEMVVLVPGLAILVFVSSQTGFSVHSRYVIPALPFFFIFASKLGRVFQMRPFTRGRRAMATMVLVMATCSLGSSLWAYPHSLSYFNELVGGPRRGGSYLLDSNVDWGQDLFYLRRWLDKHPEVTLEGLAFFALYPATLAGIPETRYAPPGPGADHSTVEGGRAEDEFGTKPGWYAVSVNYLYGRDCQYRYLLDFEPVGSAGYSIYIYHMTLDDANRFRRGLGLPELPVKWSKPKQTDHAEKA